MSSVNAVVQDEIVQSITIANDNVEVLWSAFKEYICQPYESNPERQTELILWFGELYARRDRDGLELSFHHIERVTEEIKQPIFSLSRLWSKRTAQQTPPKTFDAFCLNNQMFFSHDSAVLALPYDSKEKGTKNSRRFVGVWMHNFGKISDETCQLFANKVDVSTNKNAPSDVHAIIGKVNHELSDECLPGGMANLIPEPRNKYYSELRIQFFDNSITKHRDPPAEFSFEKERAILHSLWRTGTMYCLGNQETIEVLCPPGATSSHLFGGALHYAKGHPEGRSVVVMRTSGVQRLAQRPWRISPAVPPALVA